MTTESNIQSLVPSIKNKKHAKCSKGTEPSALEAQLAALREENARLRAERNKITLRVSEKGAVAFYGMRRFPVVLYRQEIERVLAMSEEIKAFIAKNADKLSTKGEPEVSPAKIT